MVEGANRTSSAMPSLEVAAYFYIFRYVHIGAAQATVTHAFLKIPARVYTRRLEIGKVVIWTSYATVANTLDVISAHWHHVIRVDKWAGGTTCALSSNVIPT